MAFSHTSDGVRVINVPTKPMIRNFVTGFYGNFVAIFKEEKVAKVSTPKAVRFLPHWSHCCDNIFPLTMLSLAMATKM